LRHLLGDHADHSPRATALIAKIEQGALRVRTADTVIFETVFTLERTYRQPKALIRDAVLALVELSGVELPGKRMLRRVFELYVDLNLPFADAYHAALMERHGLDQILSYDRDFDRIPGVKRIEP
jgi:predicted nucleic acid-binding protein